jgi:hypothetical protein
MIVACIVEIHDVDEDIRLCDDILLTFSSKSKVRSAEWPVLAGSRRQATSNTINISSDILKNTLKSEPNKSVARA